MKKRFLVTLLLVAMILAIVPPQTVQAAEQGRLLEDEYGYKYYIYGNGHDEPGEYTVYSDGKYYDYGGGWQQIGGKWYFFEEESGRAYASSEYDNGIYRIYGKYYAFDNNGVMKSNGWISNDDKSLWYYAGSDGVLQGSGWKSIGGKWYYFEDWFNDYGVVRTWGENNWTEIDGVEYVFDSNGALMMGKWVAESWTEEDNDGVVHTDTTWYYADADGTLAEGWRYIGGKWYYFLPDSRNMISGVVREIDGQYYIFNKGGALAGAGWVELGDGRWGYADANGKPSRGWKKSGNSWYFITESGVAATTFAIADKTLNFFKENGVWESAYKTPGWKSVKRGDYTYWFYINSDGTVATGWKSISGKWYFFNEKSGIMESFGSTKINDKIYMFDDNGNLVTKAGWYEEKYVFDAGLEFSIWYYLNSDGSCRTGWQNIGGKRYYFSEYGSMYGGGSVSTREIDGKYYLFDADGSLITKAGWYAEKETYGDEVYITWYYVNSDGTCRTGWQNIGGKRYYFSEHGWMYGGERVKKEEIDGLWYLFDTDGSLITKAGWYAKKDTNGSEVYTTWYYLNSDGSCRTGWQKIGDKWYYFVEDGRMEGGEQAGTYEIDGVTYYLDENGAMRSGWIKETDERTDDKGNVIYKHDYWYYADASGAMATGERTISGKKYLFSEYGDMRSSDYGGQTRYKGMQYTLSGSGEITKSFNYQALYK